MPLDRRYKVINLDSNNFEEWLIDDEIKDDDDEMKYHVSTIELSEIPLKHIERYLREKKLENLKSIE